MALGRTSLPIARGMTGRGEGVGDHGRRISDVRSFRKDVVFGFKCSVRSQTQPGALAGRVETGILQKLLQDYHQSPLRIMIIIYFRSGD